MMTTPRRLTIRETKTERPSTFRSKVNAPIHPKEDSLGRGAVRRLTAMPAVSKETKTAKTARAF